MNTPALILASQSASRQVMLREAGIVFEAMTPDINEEAVKETLLAEGKAPRVIADALAELKTSKITTRWPDAIVLGADQLLVCDGILFNKAADLSQARRSLEKLRGRTHRLISAAVLTKGGRPIWRHIETAEMTMRNFSDAFLDAYLAVEGEALLGSVGCYHIEGAGAQLFENVSGDCFAIRGLPLIALLEALRENGVLVR